MSSRNTLGLGLGALAVILAAEAAVRIASPVLVRPLSWYSEEAQVKADELVAHQHERGWSDVVFVGNSLTRDAFDPVQFMQAVPCELTAYNAALTGLHPQNVEHWLVHWVLPLARPSAVVMGVTSADLADESEFHDQYFGAAAVRQGIAADTVRWLERYSALLRYRAVLRDPVYLKPTVARLVPGMEPFEPWERFRRGYADPGRPGNASPVPASVHALVISESEVAALERSLQVLKERGVRTWVVEMPVQASYIDAHPGGETGYRQIMARVRHLAAGHGAEYLDLSDLLPAPEYFQDLRHVSTAGARVATARLAQALAGLCRGR